jgi:hypothetical protein
MVVDKCWFRDELLRTFANQMPDNAMRKAVFVANAYDDVVDNLKYVFPQSLIDLHSYLLILLDV